MRFVVGLAMRNVEEGTGGPFAAAVFDCGTGRLIACAVNRVVPEGVSMAHAEMLALGFAQRSEGSYDLGGGGRKMRELVTSSEPCAMCLGAIPWSGVGRVVCGARVADAVRAGFDEGQRPRRWAEGLRTRGITVLRDVCRAEAAAVLRIYGKRGGKVYNGGAAGRSEPRVRAGALRRPSGRGNRALA
jgi:tRNA(Arg) A34 adenosine deaminase TadA